MSLVIQSLRIHLPMQGAQGQSLLGKLRSHMPQGNEGTREAFVPQLRPDTAR